MNVNTIFKVLNDQLEREGTYMSEIIVQKDQTFLKEFEAH